MKFAYFLHPNKQVFEPSDDPNFYRDMCEPNSVLTTREIIQKYTNGEYASDDDSSRLEYDESVFLDDLEALESDLDAVLSDAINTRVFMPDLTEIHELRSNLSDYIERWSSANPASQPPLDFIPDLPIPEKEPSPPRGEETPDTVT